MAGIDDLFNRFQQNPDSFVQKNNKNSPGNYTAPANPTANPSFLARLSGFFNASPLTRIANNTANSINRSKSNPVGQFFTKLQQTKDPMQAAKASNNATTRLAYENTVQPAARAVGKTAAQVGKPVNIPLPGVGKQQSFTQGVGQQKGILNKGLKVAEDVGDVATLAPAVGAGLKLATKGGEIVAQDIAEGAPLLKNQGGGGHLNAPLNEPDKEGLAQMKALGSKNPQADLKAAQSGLTPPPTPKPLPTQAPVPPRVQTQVSKLLDFYKSPPPGGKTAEDVLANRVAHQQLGDKLATDLHAAMAKELSSKQLIQLDQLREGAITAKQADPAVIAIHNATLPLKEAALNTRLSINPSMGVVENYNTRIPTKISNTFEGAPKSSKSILDLGGAGPGYGDVANLTSRFGFERKIGAFKDAAGNTYHGTPQTLFQNGKKADLTLTQNKDGSYIGSDGKAYNAAPATKSEIEKGTGGAIKYETNAATIDRAYHTDTTSLKARADAVRELQRSREIVPVETSPMGEVKAEDIPKGYKLIDSSKVPELGGYAAKRSTAIQIERQLGYKDPQHWAAQAFRKGTMGVVNWIVKNPLIHGGNQLLQTGIAAGKLPLRYGGRLHSGPMGIIRTAGSLAKGMVVGKSAQVERYLKDGGHIPTYGKDNATILGRLGLPGLSKISSKGMYEIEARLRASLHDAAIRSGMDPKASVKNIDHYLGDSKAQSQLAHDTLIFSHYLKTMGGALWGHVRHPIAEGGATVNAITLFALYEAANKGWQEFTGNKDASLRAPGEIGVASQVAKTPGQILRGQAPSIVTNHVNPLLTIGVEQGTNRNLTKPVAGPEGPDNSLSDGSGSSITIGGHKIAFNGREAELINRAFAPAQTGGKVTEGKQTPLEAALGYGLGAYTPHVKGNQAAPGIKPSSILGGINAANAKPGTGEAEMKTYYKAYDAGINALKDDPRAQTLFRALHAKNPSPGVFDSPEKAAMYIDHPELLAADQKINDAIKAVGGSSNPFFDLSSSQQKKILLTKIGKYLPGQTYDRQGNTLDENLSGGVTDSKGNKVSLANQQWYQNYLAQESAYSASFPSNLPKAPSSPFDYHATDGKTQALLNQYNSISDSHAKFIFSLQHPEIQDYFSNLTNQTNAKRGYVGLDQTPGSTEITPQLRVQLLAYESLPSGTGQRTQYLSSHPEVANYFNSIYGNSSSGSGSKGGSSRGGGGVVSSIDKVTGKPHITRSSFGSGIAIGKQEQRVWDTINKRPKPPKVYGGVSVGKDVGNKGSHSGSLSATLSFKKTTKTVKTSRNPFSHPSRAGTEKPVKVGRLRLK